MNLIKGFIDVFYFEEMLHGNSIQQIGSRPTQIRSLNNISVNRRTVTSPISSPFTSPIRDARPPVVQNTKDLMTGNRFLNNVNTLFHKQQRIKTFYKFSLFYQDD